MLGFLTGFERHPQAAPAAPAARTALAQGCVPALQAVLLSRTWGPAQRNPSAPKDSQHLTRWGFAFSSFKISKALRMCLTLGKSQP